MNMEIKIKRMYLKKEYTIGKLYIDSKYFCDTLEDTDRNLNDDMSAQQIKDIKVYGSTAIPKGTYRVVLTYSPKFKQILPLVTNVKGFEGIRIHAGNTNKDTLGCILVGYNRLKGYLINSRNTMNKLMNILKSVNSQITLVLE